ncbi:MAG: response regulator [Desulfosalsimonadaceae bacterium]|nr:response regulator [Desulfosalsimonadaceae bacterium]
MINGAEDWETLLKSILGYLKEWSQCEAVGIRHKDGPDFPYFMTSGFPEEFVRSEKYLCAYGKDGDVKRGEDGKPILECMCGNILCGRFNPSKIFFTADGCFWSNCTTELLATTTDADRQARTRNRCNGEGYESVALIPLRSNNETFGLIQFNDKRKGRFTPERIALFRRIADHIANFLAKKQIEAKVAHLNAVLRGLRNVNQLITREKDPQQLIRKACDLLVEARGFHSVAVGLTDGPDGRVMAHAGAGKKLGSLLGMFEHGDMPKCARQAMANRKIVARTCSDRSCKGCPAAADLSHNQDTLVMGLEQQDRLYGFMVTCLPAGMGDDLEEQDLLQEVTGDIAFALRSMEIEAERDKSTAALADTQEQLRQAQKLEAIGQLAGGVAHDFNNLLVIIMGHVEMALDQTPPGHTIHEDLQEILGAAQRSADLTGQLLAFARKQTVSPQVVNLNETVKGILNMLRRLIGEDIDLSWNPGENLNPVFMDPGQVDQILANLCINARDAIAGVGTLTIETRNVSFDDSYCADHSGFFPGDFVMLAVSDSGCGMGKETLAHIFEPFFTTKALGHGTGLGLATVYGIVKQNNGFINVYSEPGKGTIFRIYFSRHLGDQVSVRSDVGRIAISRGNETILLVEDEPGILKLTQAMLENLGYHILPAGTPGEAIRLAESHQGKIHLLLTDVIMPEMNGRDLAARISALSPETKLIFSSGYTANVIAHRSVLEPGVNFIQKPFSRRELGEKLRAVLDGVL